MSHRGTRLLCFEEKEGIDHMYGPHRTLQHLNGDFHWFLHTRLCRIVARVVIVALLLVDAPFQVLENAFAQGTTVFGPENFVRSTGAPKTISRTFSVSNPSGPATLCQANGGVNNQYGRVSSAVITVNNTQVLQPNDFNQQVSSITRPVTLKTSNTLQVEVRSAPGSGFTLTLVHGGSANCPRDTVNRPPVAKAGTDQTVNVGVTVQLDGRQSSDPDGNPLTYSWTLLSKPTGSTISLTST